MLPVPPAERGAISFGPMSIYDNIAYGPRTHGITNKAQLDDIVDDYFNRVKAGIIRIIAENPTEGEYALDLLMIAKYFERIGDHCTNIAEWVEFSVTGIHKDCQ